MPEATQSAAPHADTPSKTRAAKPVFNWQVPFGLMDQLSEYERLVAETARGYAQDKLMPRVLESFRNETFDRDIFNEMGDLGFLGPTVPEEYGGAGVNHV